MITNDLIFWVLGVASTLVAAGFGFAIRAHSEISTRVTRLEAVMSMFGQKAAKILHQDDDHAKMDALLDKYLDRSYELSHEEWVELLAKCELIENDKSKTKGERTLAAFLGAVCGHKLMKPPTVRKSE